MNDIAVQLRRLRKINIIELRGVVPGYVEVMEEGTSHLARKCREGSGVLNSCVASTESPRIQGVCNKDV